MAEEKTFENQMQPDESAVAEDRLEQKQEQEADNSNRMNMGGPSMRPSPKPAPKELTPAQQKAQEQAKQRSHELTQEMVAAQTARQNWINKPGMMRRINNTLAKDPVVRDAVFTAVKGGAVAFTSLDARTQLRVVKNADKQLRQMAQNAVAAMTPGVDPNDVTHPFNQANPNNLANQRQAIEYGIVMDQDNQVAQQVLTMDNQVAQEQQVEEEMAENNLATMELTAAEEEEINSHNAEFNPSPKPGAQPDDEELKEGEKALAEDGLARAALEHKGEEKALESFMKNDKAGFMEGAKGGEKEVAKTVAEEGMKVGMSLAKAAVAA